MNTRKSRLFTVGCLLVGTVYVVTAGQILLQGVTTFMRPFGLPETILSSPHYENAIFYHFYDMFVIGAMLIITGWFAESIRFQRVFSATMFVLHLVYLYLDLQTSDTVFGNALYKGAGSAVPPAICFVATIVFLTLSISAFRYREPNT